MRSQIKLWLSHPVTKALLSKLVELKESHLAHLLHMRLDSNNYGMASELIGRIDSLNTVLNPDLLNALLEDEVEEDGTTMETFKD